MKIDLYKFNQICSVFFNVYPKLEKITLCVDEETSEFCLQFWKRQNITYNPTKKTFVRENRTALVYAGLATTIILSKLNMTIDDEDFKNKVLAGHVFNSKSSFNIEKESFNGMAENLGWVSKTIMGIFDHVIKVRFMPWNSLRLYYSNSNYINLIFRGCGFSTRIHEEFSR